MSGITSPAQPATTITLARDLALSIAGNRVQASVSLLALAAGAALGGPWIALASLAGAGALLAARWKISADMGAARNQPFALRLGRDANGGDIMIDSAREKGNVLVLGTTGSGKTEALLGIAEESIAKGSGVVFCDGKGDVSLFVKMFWIAFKHGREDDLLVLNMMTGHPHVDVDTDIQLSNTFNPFATQDASTLTQLTLSLFEDIGGDGAMWKGRSQAMLQGIMQALVWLRDNEGLALDPGVVREHLGMRVLIDIASGERHPRLPSSTRLLVNSYLRSLPGYSEERGYRQAQTTQDQHGYLEMQFTKILGSLADVYGHIFKTTLSEIDMDDVVSNRRILVVMLPALEKSGDELANLGKIVAGALKGTILKANDTLEASDVPPPVFILDEIGYYTVDGLALASTRARDRYGAVTVFATQDIASMMRLNEREGASIVAQAGTQIIMRLEGENPVFGQGGDVEGVGLMQPGEMVVRNSEGAVRGNSLYAGSPPTALISRLKLRSNHFIRMPKARGQAMETA